MIYNLVVEKKRFEHIDLIRAVSIIGIIATHTLSYNLANKTDSFIWNYLHFFVPAFVFCSGYVLTIRYKDKLNTFSDILTWYKKRVLRLLIPFYVYLCIHFLLWILFPNFISGLGLTKSAGFILRSATLTGGVNVNWLTLLFIQMTILYPLLLKIYRKKHLLWIYLLTSLLITKNFTVNIYPYEYFRYVMWIPWSPVLLFSIFASVKEMNETKAVQFLKKYLIGFLAGISLFIILYLTWQNLGKSLSLIDYKYPPGLYYLSYAFGMTCLLIALSRFITVENKILVSLYMYVSKNSYQLFFLHLIILDFTLKNTYRFNFLPNSGFQFVFVTLSSILISYLINRIKNPLLYSLKEIANIKC